MPLAFVHMYECMAVQVKGNTNITRVQRLARCDLLLTTYFLANATYQCDSNNFSARLLNLLQAVHEVPELGLCLNLVRSEDPHPVELRIPDLLGRYSPSDDLKLLQLHG